VNRSVARLREVLEPVVATAGFDLEDVAVTPAGRRSVLRLVVDRDDGVSLDDVAEVSRAASAALDAVDAMGASPYVLEVSSPGVDRPLEAPRHWRRAAGRLVRVTLRDGGSLAGRVRTADDEKVVLHVDGTERMLSYEEIVRGKVQIEFDREMEGGG